MQALIAAAGILAVAAITPGPNNLVVMTAGARSGIRGALAAVAGIVLGTLALAGVVVAGVGALFEVAPVLRSAMTLGGCAYLSWLGIRLIAQSIHARVNELPHAAKRLPSAAIGLFAFQFLNPKSWIAVLTVASAVNANADAATLWQLAGLLAAIPTICLVLWSALGAVMTTYLAQSRTRVWFQRAMGSLLVVSAILLGFAP